MTDSLLTRPLRPSSPSATEESLSSFSFPMMNREAPFLEHPLVGQAITILEERLPGGLFYHNKEHTIGVLSTVCRLAEHDQLSQKDTELLAIAAAWHDVGYSEQQHQNEPLAAAWIGEAMRATRQYTDGEISEVQRAILDTEMKPREEDGTLHQIATGRLSPWLLDGDLANFGASDFLTHTFRLMRELGFGQVHTPSDLLNPKMLTFLEGSSRLLSAHSWQTRAASELLQPGKIINQENLSSLIAAVRDRDQEALERIWESMLPHSREPYRLRN